MADSPSHQAVPPVESAQVRNHLLYSLSLPERAFRSASGMVGGALREASCLLVPQAFQDSKTYSVLVRQMLDFMAEDIGGVKRKDEACQGVPQVDNYVARKTVGNFVDLAGMATLHLSPLVVLAVFSDVAYGSQTFLKQLAEELKAQGIIEPDSTIDRASDLVTALGDASGIAANTFDTPPLSIDGLRETINDARKAAGRLDPASVIPQAEIARMWAEMNEIAQNEGVSLLNISSAMTLYSLQRIGKFGGGALSGAKVAGNLLDRAVFDHYRGALIRLRTEGFYAMLAESSAPYIEAVWENFSCEKPTLTEDFVSGRMLSKAGRTVMGWLGCGQPADILPGDGTDKETESKVPAKPGADDPKSQPST
ncbi:MAG: hypothetical protein WDZ59_06755 [Pirellulales bacterium]